MSLKNKGQILIELLLVCLFMSGLILLAQQSTKHFKRNYEKNETLKVKDGKRSRN
jgi:hypothetical protein